jgi:hypothetical protein
VQANGRDVLAEKALALTALQNGLDRLDHRRIQRLYGLGLLDATQMPGTATFWNGCGKATAEDG